MRDGDKNQTTESWRQLQEAFLDLLELGPEARRESLAARSPSMAGELLAMLRAHGEDGALDIESCLLQEGGALADRDSDSRLIGQSLGPYRIVREIGRGGMGAVFLAERSDGYEQEVAIKIMRWGLGGEAMEERFRRERQILARLDHPHIAQLLDGGVSDDGRLYLVMQKIDGPPITEHCDRHRLDIPARLRLFCDVCEAVDYAHRNLVVHRDLKPSNILIAEAGSEGRKAQVKLLDFGIAKLLEAEEDDVPGPGVVGSAVTVSEMRLMTPEHAAPEQIRGEAVTTATDTYALGVLLYQLLVGERPFPGDEISRQELETRICETPPPPPSQLVRSRLRKEGVGEERVDAAAAVRSTAPAKLARSLRGDLDTIVARALAKEPDRRYGSALQLAEDVQRHLEGLPVRARPDSLAYRVHRFVTRHSWQVAAAVALLVLAAAFTVTTVFQARALERERDEARLERQTAEQVADVLVELFELANPSRTPDGRKLTIDVLLELHSDQVIQRLEDQPAVRSRLRHMLGRVHSAHSRFEQSRQLYEDALEERRQLAGPDDVEVLTIEHDLAVLARVVGDRGRAERLLRASLGNHLRLFGEESSEAAQCMQDLAGVLPVDAPEKRRLLEKSLLIRQKLELEPDIDTASSINDLGLIDLWSLDLDRAVSRFREVSALVERLRGPDHPYTLSARGNLAAALMRSGRFAEAVEIDKELLEKKRAAYGDESTVVAKALNNLGTTVANLGEWPAAEETLREAFETFRRVVGEDHSDTVNSARNLARVVEFLGRPEEALTLLEAATAAQLEVEPGEEPFFANQRAALEMRLGRPQKAARELRKILGELESLFPENDYRVAQTDALLGEALLLIEGDREANARKAAESYRRAYASQSREPLRSEAACGLARALVRLGEIDEARRLFSQCLGPYQSWGLVHTETKEAVARAAESVFGGAEGSSTEPARPEG